MGERSTQSDDVFRRFMRRIPRQSRSRSLVDAVLQAFDDILRHEEDPKLGRVAERAGVGVGSFYEYFAGKDQLLGALIGRITRENFETLLSAMDEAGSHSLDDAAVVLSRRVLETYLEHPRRMRVVFYGVGRLRLLPVIVRERDRFAGELTDRIEQWVPHADRVELEETMRVVCDAAMGLVGGALYREPIDLDGLTDTLSRLSTALIRDRHPAR